MRIVVFQHSGVDCSTCTKLLASMLHTLGVQVGLYQGWIKDSMIVFWPRLETYLVTAFTYKLSYNFHN